MSDSSLEARLCNNVGFPLIDFPLKKIDEIKIGCPQSYLVLNQLVFLRISF